MQKRIVLVVLLTLASGLFLFAGGQQDEGMQAADGPVNLMVWHDKGKKGINIFNDLGAYFTASNPNVTVESVSFDTQTFIQKSIAAILSDSAPDLVFNDWFRLIPIELQTNGFLDLSDAIDPAFEAKVPDVAMKMGYYNDKQITYPHQISQIALGVRTSWLEAVGGEVPETFDDFLALAKKFTYEDPDGNGKDDTFGYSGYFGAGILETLRYWSLAAGINNLVLNEKGEPSFNSPRHKEVVRFLVSLYRPHKVVPADSLSHTYIEMYQLIEGDKVGLFRVGNWNVPKWDGLFEGDYQITNWPVLNKGDKPTQQLYTMRGCAVPENSPNPELAVEFVKAGGDLEGQMVHYKYNSSFARNDLDVLDISENQKYFFEEMYEPTYNILAPDVHTSKYRYAPKIEELYEQALQEIVVDPNADVDAIMEEAEADAWKIIRAERS